MPFMVLWGGPKESQAHLLLDFLKGLQIWSYSLAVPFSPHFVQLETPLGTRVALPSTQILDAMYKQQAGKAFPDPDALGT